MSEVNYDEWNFPNFVQKIGGLLLFRNFKQVPGGIFFFGLEGKMHHNWTKKGNICHSDKIYY